MAKKDGGKHVGQTLLALARRAAGGSRGVQGFVDAVLQGHTVVGWARDPKDVTRRLEIQLLDGEQVVGFGIADLPRKDLLQQQIGDGRYGFRLRLAPALLDGVSRTLTVCAVTQKGKVPLQRGTVTLAAADTPEPVEAERRPPSPATMVGALERMSGRALHGWAFNPDQPDAPALVDLYDDERYLGSVMADRSRPRLYEKGFPSGARGFVFELPAEVGDDATERLRARVAGTVYDLRRSKDFAHDPAGTGAGAASPPAQAAEPATAPVAPPPPPPPLPPSVRSEPSPPPATSAAPPKPAAPPLPAQPVTVALCVAGPADAAAATFGDWAAQTVEDVRLLARAMGASLPDRFAGSTIALGHKTAIAQVARAATFVLFAPAGARLDPALAAAIATVPNFPDVVVVDEQRPQLSGEAARAETFVAPDRARVVAVRADLLPACPGNLRRDLEDGLCSPLMLWLAGRDDLLWTTLSVPGATATTEPAAERRPRAWGAVLDADRWTIEGATLTPARAPDRISLGLWRGWDQTGLPALAALVADHDGLLDLLVPTDGDDAQGRARLDAAAQVLAAAGRTEAVRARIVDCAPGDAAVIRALLRAADGDALLLSDGSAAVPSGELLRMARWALDPHTGPVGLADAHGSSGVTLEGGLALRPAGPASIADAVSFRLMMVATARLAAAEPVTGPVEPDGAALLWCRALAEQGFQSTVLAATASLDGTLPGFAAPALSWDVAARLRATWPVAR